MRPTGGDASRRPFSFSVLLGESYDRAVLLASQISENANRLGRESPACDGVVARSRFELLISALRGRRPRPLDERAIFSWARHWLGWRESNSR